MTNNSYFIGIDVGTGSAGAGIFDAEGNMLALSSHPITITRPKTDFVQQSSDDIWNVCCIFVKEAVQKAGIISSAISGIRFDATCSLVVSDEYDNPLTISPDGDQNQNILVWMDHRANGEAAEIDETGHEVLRYVGGVISPEMQTPKLLWLKRNMPDMTAFGAALVCNIQKKKPGNLGDLLLNTQYHAVKDIGIESYNPFRPEVRN